MSFNFHFNYFHQKLIWYSNYFLKFDDLKVIIKQRAIKLMSKVLHRLVNCIQLFKNNWKLIKRCNQMKIMWNTISTENKTIDLKITDRRGRVQMKKCFKSCIERVYQSFDRMKCDITQTYQTNETNGKTFGTDVKTFGTDVKTTRFQQNIRRYIPMIFSNV